MKYLRFYENFNLTKNKTLTKEEFQKILEERCSDFKWEDRPIYRSIASNNSYLYINSSIHKNSYTQDGITYRKSMQSGYGRNYLHTPLMNHLNSWNSCPKRQLICSTSARTFMGYQNNLYRVIPFNGSNWGIVPNFDIHNCKLSDEFSKLLSGLLSNITNQDFNINYISQLNIIRTPKSKDELLYPEYGINYSNYISTAPSGAAESIEDWKDVLNFCSKVDTSGGDWVFSESPSKPLTIDILNKLFTPASVGIKKMSYLEYKNSFGSLPPYEYDGKIFSDDKKIYDSEEPNPGHEIWTDSNVLLVKASVADRLMKQNK